MKQERNNGQARKTRGFTLVEVLVVIALIMLLVTMIVPSIGRAVLLSKVAASRARIHSLAAACQNYFDDSGRRYFPGQQYPEMLKGYSPAGALTGSEVLALALFNPKNGGNTTRAGLRSTSTGYIAYKDDWFVDNTGLVIADAVGDGKAIVYYPSRIGQTGLTGSVFNAFFYADNASLTGSDIATFNSYIADPKFSDQHPYNETTFLLMAPGASRTYFNNGDPSNF